MNGGHRPTGVLFLSERTVAGAASIEDLAPTVLAALGVAAPPMDGTSLFNPPPSSGDGTPYSPLATPYSPQQERAVEERLRALGYLE
jgi:arylsulfatase A-like enzyme